MRKKERAEYIAVRLDEIYPKTPVPLDHGDNFQLLVAVLLSAQCTDERVNMVTPTLFSMADNPKDMAALKESDILGAIRTCGLAPKKSKAIKALSSILINDYSGEVPSSYSDLELLPGVGHKTASVVMSQGFGYPAFPVDTHIHRLAQRWGLTKKK
jgi:endonuclease-3